MALIPTTRGGKKLLFDGYAYIVDKRKERITYWRCERRGICGGRVKTADGIVQGAASTHSHPPYTERHPSSKALRASSRMPKPPYGLKAAIAQDFPIQRQIDATDFPLLKKLWA